MRLLRVICAASVLALLSGTAPAETISGRAIAFDGDTIWIDGTRIRLFGVSAVEMRDGGHFARGAIDDELAKGKVTCEQRDTDRYKRPVAICGVEGGADDLSLWLLENGQATVYRTFTAGTPFEEPYDAAERRARLANLGVWHVAEAQNGSLWERNEAQLVGGAIAIVAALLGAVVGAYASIVEIRRIRREMRTEKTVAVARIMMCELRMIEETLEELANQASASAQKARHRVLTKSQTMYEKNGHELHNLPPATATKVIEAYTGLAAVLSEDPATLSIQAVQTNFKVCLGLCQKAIRSLGTVVNENDAAV